jgi:hypothetical protein
MAACVCWIWQHVVGADASTSGLSCRLGDTASHTCGDRDDRSSNTAVVTSMMILS